ncbi:hypothetical protein [Lewinella sp. JB7]|uniref:hypothetical protein n=1 Tax=Lewinella sp. JB7 TaxID=2962887 RepID=UPI0020C9725D|nr:hypothetical protein [Lewinella sp. JB7]MCP9237623.1 hypothetical protein [Lewinella sp. JB7]
MESQRNNHTAWRICCTLAVVILCLAFSPLFIPAGQHAPLLLGLPYALWTGIALCVLMVVITYVATLVHPGNTSR